MKLKEKHAAYIRNELRTELVTFCEYGQDKLTAYIELESLKSDFDLEYSLSVDRTKLTGLNIVLTLEKAIIHNEEGDSDEYDHIDGISQFTIKCW
jgi:hypothetical protein